jgi:hypothetical protein
MHAKRIAAAEIFFMTIPFRNPFEKEKGATRVPRAKSCVFNEKHSSQAELTARFTCSNDLDRGRPPEAAKSYRDRRERDSAVARTAEFPIQPSVIGATARPR